MREIVETCPNCGCQVPPDAPAMLCPGCLVRGGLSEEGSLTQPEVGSGGTLHIVIPEDLTLPKSMPKQLGSYELLELIAHGGMGVVYKARHTGLDRLVALKMIQSGILASGSDVERFQREARSAARLHHPNIVTIHDIGEQDGQHYYAMDYVPGENLAERARRMPFSPRQAAEITRGVAAAIHYAHEHGVLHRDIKPANVILTPEQQPRVLDFGLALVLADDSKLTLSGTPMGSPPYMPPEQAAGRTRQIDARSDVYSLGALLYELITGRPPFQAASTLETLQLVLHNEAVSPRRLNPALPRDLETICLKCLEKAPERRYQTAQELSDELGRFIRDEPILARPVSPVEKVWRWCRRKPLVASLSATTLALLVSVAIGSPIALYRINQDQARARALMKQLQLQSYATDMKEASLALEEQNRGAAQELIQKHLPKADQDLRGLEWRYLWTLLRGDELAILRGHKSGVREVVFSSDGKLLASSGLDQIVRVWEVQSRRPLKELPGVTDLNLHQSIAFAPDGSALAVAGGGKIILWKTSDWQPLRQPLAVATAPIVFSPDGRILAARSDSKLMLWDTTTWQAATLNTDSSQGVRGCLAIAPDNRLLALAFAFGAPLQLWDLAARVKVNQFEIGTASLTFGPKGNQLTIGGWASHQVRLLDCDSGRFVATFSTGANQVFGVAFSLDQKVLATPVGQLIHLYDVVTGEKRATLRGHHGDIHALAHSPVAPLLASASLDGTIRLWSDDPSRHTNVWDVPSGIDLLSPGPTRPRLCSWATNGWLQFWGIIDGRLTPTFALPSDEKQPDRFAERVQCSPDGSYAAYGTTDGQVHVYECAKGRVISNLPIGKGNTRAAAFSPDNRWLFTAEEGEANLTSTEKDTNAILWNWRTKQVETRFSDGYCAFLNLPVATFSPDGRLLAYVAQGYTVNLWDTVAKQVRLKLRGHGWLICAINFSPDGRSLATSSYDGSTRVWDVVTGRSARKLELQSQVVWFTHDSRTLVTASPQSVRFWNVATGQETLAIRNATGALLSPDNTAFVLWRREGVSLMRIPTLGEIQAVEMEH